MGNLLFSFSFFHFLTLGCFLTSDGGLLAYLVNGRRLALTALFPPPFFFPQHPFVGLIRQVGIRAVFPSPPPIDYAETLPPLLCFSFPLCFFRFGQSGWCVADNVSFFPRYPTRAPAAPSSFFFSMDSFSLPTAKGGVAINLLHSALRVKTSFSLPANERLPSSGGSYGDPLRSGGRAFISAAPLLSLSTPDFFYTIRCRPPSPSQE